jgi:hypothetical protein
MYPVYVIRNENSEQTFFHARLMHMRQMVTFGKLSKGVDITGTGSVCWSDHGTHAKTCYHINLYMLQTHADVGREE